MKTSNLLWLGTIGLATLASCGEEDLFDAQKMTEIKTARYAASFKAHFGDVPANFSWDASSGTPRLAATTRALENTYTTSDWEEVQPNILEWMNGHLVEGKNNKALGRSFVMSVPSNEFSIMPIYQGKASTQGFDFYIVVDDQPIKIWSKSADFEVCDATFTRATAQDGWQLTGVGEWHSPLTMDAKNGLDANTIMSTVLYNGEGKTVNAEGSAVKKVVRNYKVRARKYTFDLTQYAGHVMYCYLEITAGNNSQAAKLGTKQSSTGGMIVALDGCPVPEGLDEGTQTMILGCEGANLTTDWDMNEVVFLLCGKPYTPEVIEIRDDKIDKVTAKRYMFEDLGSTDDFDFNDVVIDFKDISTIQLHYENGVKQSESEVAHRQEATIRHLGGMLPFDIKVDGLTIYSGGSTGTLGTNPDLSIILPDSIVWNPGTNNVSLAVTDRGNSETLITYDIDFPQIGYEAPMVIATDTNVEWMEERTSITREWFRSINPWR